MDTYVRFIPDPPILLACEYSLKGGFFELIDSWLERRIGRHFLNFECLVVLSSLKTGHIYSRFSLKNKCLRHILNGDSGKSRREDLVTVFLAFVPLLNETGNPY